MDIENKTPSMVFEILGPNDLTVILNFSVLRLTKIARMWNFAQNASNENFNNLLSFLVFTNILKISSARKYKFRNDYDPTAQ